MKIKYNKNLEYQTEAVNAVVGLFEGGENFLRSKKFSLNSEFEVVSNHLELEEEILKDNLQRIQKENFKGKEDKIVFSEDDLKDFSVEMETGTGKTYTYLETIFEEEFEALKLKYSFFKNKDVKKVHNGYFSSTGKTKKVFKDTKGNSANDKEIYNLIMKDKERLLSFEENTSFIFSHSALKEGWDNPNIFQICTLNETVSKMKKRQEIGRGMRLCLNKNGDRIYGRNINKLVVVPNESYRNYVSKLQTEFDESGQKAIIPPNGKKRKTVRLKKETGINLPEFKKLWKKNKPKNKI